MNSKLIAMEVCLVFTCVLAARVASPTEFAGRCLGSILGKG
jgi:hypothetical protein